MVDNKDMLNKASRLSEAAGDEGNVKDFAAAQGYHLLVTQSLVKHLGEMDKKVTVVSDQMEKLIVPAMQRLDERLKRTSGAGVNIFEFSRGNVKVKVAGIGGLVVVCIAIAAGIYAYHMKLQSQIQAQNDQIEALTKKPEMKEIAVESQ